MIKTIKGRSTDTIFVLIVFSIFAFSVLMVLMLGASVYRNINDISRAEQHEHTAFSYIWTKTKNFDEAGAITVGEFGGVSAILINEKIGETDYRTAIYVSDGWLLELFSEAALDFSPQSGRRIVEIDEMTFNETDLGMIEIVSGNKKLLLSPRTS
ncbi:MAG: DUF4860 domain-containing protein [Oscillospiraceae bacterium]|nr:DUF4860 domain-containing protein [Oscillospiraceae bacterium]